MIQAKRNLCIHKFSLLKTLKLQKKNLNKLASTGGRIISVEINCPEIRQGYQGQDSHYVNGYEGN